MTDAPAHALTAERLFEQVFWPLYPQDVRDDLTHARMTDANPAGNRHLLDSLDEIAHTFVHMAPSVFAGDDLALDYSDASVHRLSAALTRARRDAWMRERGPDGASLLAHVVVHGAIYVARCAVIAHGGEWRVRRPLWESLVRLVSAAGDAELAVFHWWLKSLSDAEIDRDTLADRYRANVEQPRLDPRALPTLLAGRAVSPIPRLAKVRYDTLFKHLKAHVPELRELGEHFPSATRFAELGFQHLDFMWLGDGRLLLIHGPGAQGVHLFWLDGDGFRQAAFFPAERGSTYRLSCAGDVLRIELEQGGRRQEHEMLWWGV